MGSKRLPGKVLEEVLEMPIFIYQLRRIEQATKIEKMVVATTTSSSDDPIVACCEKYGYRYYRGDEDDVLTRYYEAADLVGSKHIARLTADCPVIDPVIIDKTIEFYFAQDCDFCANTVPVETRTFPEGMDIEIFGVDSLTRAFQECKNSQEREHVTFYFWQGNNGFSCSQLNADKKYQDYRLTLDYPEDLKVLKFIIEHFGLDNIAYNLDDIVSLLNAHPEIASLNYKYYHGIGWEA